MERHKKPFTCYFCHQKIENDTEMGHTSVCGSVLVPCSYRCGSYVPRMDMASHKNDCFNRPSRSMTRLTTTTDTVETYDNFSSTNSLDRKTYRDSLDRLQKDFQKLSSRLADCERAASSGARNQDLEYHNQVFQKWKKTIDVNLDVLKQSLGALDKRNGDTEYHLADLQQKLAYLENVRIDINTARTDFLREQTYNREATLEFAKDLDEFKGFFKHENSVVNDKLHAEKELLEILQTEVDTLKEFLDEQKTKTVSIVFDIKTISQIASETAEKLEIQEREFAKFTQQFDQMRLDLEFLENLASADARTSSPGHLIWKISDFEAKMSKAKSSNTVLKSPIFYTHDFGYKARLLVYLNGLKKWKDRYTLISLHVVKGDFDALLKWPCHIEGTVLLRDQENTENPKNFSKRISAKRQTGDEDNEEPQESSNSYIFIPHGTITKGCYFKNDEIFLEIRIEQNKKLATETTL